MRTDAVYVIIPVLLLVAIVATLVDIIRREEWQVKHLPRVVWILLVVLIPLVGMALWFALGREYSVPVAQRPSRESRRQAESTLGGHAGPMHDPRSTEQQLADLEKEIEHYDRMRDRRIEE